MFFTTLARNPSGTTSLDTNSKKQQEKMEKKKKMIYTSIFLIESFFTAKYLGWSEIQFYTAELKDVNWQGIHLTEQKN